MRRPLRSRTGMDSNSVKKRRLSAIENRRASRQARRVWGLRAKFDTTIALYTAFLDACFQYGASRSRAATKKCEDPFCAYHSSLGQQAAVHILSVPRFH